MRIIALLCLTGLAGCGGSVWATNSSEAASEAAMPADAVVLPGAAIPAMLRQCSRQAPTAGEGGWQPGAADIAAVETAAAAALRERHASGDPDWSRFPRDWRRQYVGIVRGGRRFIYGNFYSRGVDEDARDPDQWRREPIIVCDGGSAFFGVEYDVEAGRLTQLAFNGNA